MRYILFYLPDNPDKQFLVTPDQEGTTTFYETLAEAQASKYALLATEPDLNPDSLIIFQELPQGAW